MYTHNGANFTDNRSYHDPKVANLSAWSKFPVLLITRDPRDVLVSAYHHAKYRDKIYDGTISDFVRSDETGIDKILTALNRWNDARDIPPRFDVLSYESMHNDPHRSLRLTVETIGLVPDGHAINAAVDFASFENMKKLERSDTLKDKAMRASSSQESGGAKVREGKVGGYVNHLSMSDLDYINGRIQYLGDPFSPLPRGTE